MAIGTPVQLGTGSGNGGSHVITTVANCPAGNLIVISTCLSLTSSIASIVDSAGNTYTILDSVTGNPGLFVSYCANCLNLPSGGTITLTTSSGGTAQRSTAMCVSGIATSSPVDTSNHTATGSAATSATSVSTGTLAQASELVVGVSTFVTAISGYTPGGSFTAIGGVSTSSGVQNAYQIVSAATAVAYAPSWTTASNYRTDIVSFKDAAGGVVITDAEIACAAQTVAEEPLRAHYLPSVEAY